MKLYKKLLLVAAGVTFMYSCDDYLDINTDPNNPRADVVSPDLVLPAAQNGSYSALANTPNRLGNIMMNQWAGDVTNFTGGNADEYRFNVTSSFYSGVWNNAYLVTDKLQAIINKDSEENANFAAIARILKVANMHLVVDMYGDIPYSEAFQRGQNYTPSYDSAVSVYVQMFDELTAAINNIDNASPLLAIDPKDSDAMLGGNMATWKKFANTLRLKLLVRASSSTDPDAVTFVNDNWSKISGASFLGNGENIENNPGYSASPNKQNYFWEVYGFTPGGDRTQTNKFIVGSEYFIEYLKGNIAPIAPFDNRISAFFTTASGSGGDYQGVEQGADDPDDINIGLSFIGSGLLSSASQSGKFFTAAESFFLQAEAAMNGKISGDPKTLFENGIRASFNMYGLNPDAYIAGIQNVPTVGWTNDPTADLEAIMRQKWIALHSINGLESYIEQTRTGYPNPPLPLLTSKTVRPYRLLYPLSELTGNTANVPNVGVESIFAPSLFYQK